MRIRLALAALVCLAIGPAPVLARAADPPPQASNGPEGAAIPSLLDALTKVVAAGRPTDYLALLGSTADRDEALQFARDNFGAPANRAVVRERARLALAAGAFRLTVEVFFEFGDRGRIDTWQIDVRRQPKPTVSSSAAGSPPDRWLIEGQRRVSYFADLYRLRLDANREMVARDLVITAPDLRLELARGSVFVADAGGDATAMVLLGKGRMVFSPGPPTERGQLRIFSGKEVLETEFDACYFRLNPASVSNHLNRRPPVGPADAREVERAQRVFLEDAPQSYALDVADLGPGFWSTLPDQDDVIAEIHTPHFGTLTYSRTLRQPEDLALFDRKHHDYIALYASPAKLATRGPFYSDDDGSAYTALHYDIDATFEPDREWVEGRSTMQVRVRAASISSLEVRLADSLAVKSVVIAPFGPVEALRVRGQNAIVVTLPAAVTRDTSLTLTVTYAGRLPPQPAEPEAAFRQSPFSQTRVGALPRSYLYSARSAWYAQAPVTSYATATLRLTVPLPFDCVASGKLVSTTPIAASPPASAARQFLFDAPVPLRYLACLVSRLVQVTKETIALPRTAATAPSEDSSLQLTVDSNPEERAQARQVTKQVEDIVRFYTSVTGHCPYPDLTVALLEGNLPGGHSPAYLAVLNEQAPTSPLTWRDDPAHFPGFPEFFAAHEIAHQWWGQAVGGKNYHEEWLSEGFAQYFAALYAEHVHGHEEFAAIIRDMRHWTLRDSSRGPVHLGDRIGHIGGDPRAFRAVVYDKGALVLQMVRELLGDEAFFRGIRRFYEGWQFRKAGSDDLRRAFEAASGRPLGRFFDRWIYGDTLPRLEFSWRVVHTTDGDVVDLRFDQVGDVFDLPMAVTVVYRGGTRMDIVVPITDRTVDRRVPVTGRVKDVLVNRDDFVPADIVSRAGRR